MAPTHIRRYAIAVAVVAASLLVGLAVRDSGNRLSLLLFAGIGALIAWLNRQAVHRGAQRPDRHRLPTHGGTTVVVRIPMAAS